ncbi:MAG: lipopolysaccharide biosynthesis protein, partial [Clostridia bacterium]|nr:lipopolysaccharide biosynthesis protein [Clostridia bacterium]
FVGTVLSKLVSFLMLPLYTSKVPSEQMGIFDVSVTLVTMVFSVCYFEIWSAVLRYLYSKENSENQAGVIKSGWKIFGLSTIVFIAVSILMCGVMGYDYAYLIIGYGIACALSNQITFIARGLGLNAAFSVSGIINTLVHLSLNVLLLTVFQMDYSALYISYIVGVLAQAVYLGICILKKKSINEPSDKTANSKLAVDMFKYALPLCLNTVSYWLLTSFNRVVFNNIFGNSASGIFSIGNKFGSIIALVTTCFTYAWQDLAFSNTTDDDMEKNSALYTGACHKYQLFLVASTTMLLPFVKIIFPILVKGDYSDALSLVPSFILVAVISGYSAFIGNVFYAIKNTKIISISTIISAVFNLMICYPLIKYFGGNGTNIATILAFVVNIAIRAIILRKKTNFDIKIMSILVGCVWIAATVWMYYSGNIIGQIITLVLNVGISLVVFRNDIAGFLVRKKK